MVKAQIKSSKLAWVGVYTVHDTVRETLIKGWETRDRFVEGYMSEAAKELNIYIVHENISLT